MRCGRSGEVGGRGLGFVLWRNEDLVSLLVLVPQLGVENLVGKRDDFGGGVFGRDADEGDDAGAYLGDQLAIDYGGVRNAGWSVKWRSVEKQAGFVRAKGCRLTVYGCALDALENSSHGGTLDVDYSKS